MISSMTAFARKSIQAQWGSAVIELRSVNHRYLEVNTRLPELLRELEMPIRDLMRKKLPRGKVDCTIRYQLNEQGDESLPVNHALVQQILAASAQVAETAAVAPIDSIKLLSWPGVVTSVERDMAQVHKEVIATVKEAVHELQQTRQREGDALKQLIEDKLQGIEQQVVTLKPLIPQILEAQRQKLLDRLAEIKQELDESRLEQEMVILAQKIDVIEELERLETHVAEVRRVLKKGGACGRRLDFLMQELNREANTLASKSVATENTQAAVELKVLIEQMREQIQNIE